MMTSSSQGIKSSKPLPVVHGKKTKSHWHKPIRLEDPQQTMQHRFSLQDKLETHKESRKVIPAHHHRVSHQQTSVLLIKYHRPSQPNHVLTTIRAPHRNFRKSAIVKYQDCVKLVKSWTLNTWRQPTLQMPAKPNRGRRLEPPSRSRLNSRPKQWRQLSNNKMLEWCVTVQKQPQINLYQHSEPSLRLSRHLHRIDSLETMNRADWPWKSFEAILRILVRMLESSSVLEAIAGNIPAKW